MADDRQRSAPISSAFFIALARLRATRKTNQQACHITIIRYSTDL
ncbi:hypothetical protein [Hallella colorans]|uniref:Uncharacterized protein n=1 Tax=Hallella colorans TaxID=1703337 RepID=A0A2U0TZ25_9BACT|nr:hypothetical protein [Hallella colorans]PVX48868.1 hypothetical protein C7379_1229 [Hallella colorans]